MALPHYYLFALINPMGRLSQAPFALLAIGLAFAHIWIFGLIADHRLGLTWNPYTIALFAMLWMQFCIFTRRLRDTGSSGGIMVPVLLIAVFVFAVALDPNTEAPAGMNSFMGDIVARWGLRLLRALYVAMLIYCIKAGGEEGPNAYGPEFGDPASDYVPGVTPNRRAAAQPAYQGFDRRKKSPPGWADRRRPEGFGRR